MAAAVNLDEKSLSNFFLKNLVAKQSASLASDSSRIRFLEKHVFYIIVLKKICPKQDQRGAAREAQTVKEEEVDHPMWRFTSLPKRVC
jgi:hypothetical protein